MAGAASPAIICQPGALVSDFCVLCELCWALCYELSALLYGLWALGSLALGSGLLALGDVFCAVCVTGRVGWLWYVRVSV